MPETPEKKPAVTKGDFKHALGDLGVTRGDVVAFHTSLSAFGHVEGGADTVIDAILETVLPEGTALAPTLTFSCSHSPECPPVFDVRETPSVTGRTPEVFRKRPGAVRSLHPTHSWTAIGSQALEMAAGHEDSPTPCGQKSPLGRLVEARGKVLLLGVTLYSLTLIHYCEEVAEAPYHLQEKSTHCVMRDASGARVERDLYLHRWGGFEWALGALERDLVERGAMRKAQLGAAEIRMLDARATADIIIDNLRRNPEYLLE